MPEIIYGEQRDERWHKLRLASVGSTAINEIAPGKTGYENRLYKFAGEYLTGVRFEKKKFQYADRGHEFETAAREMYELVNGVEVELIALIKGDTPHTHTSTDGLMGDKGILEVKVRIPSEFIKLDNGKTPPIADMRQCYWDLYISGRDYVDYVNYCPELVKAERGGYLEQRIGRDVKKIAELKVISDRFIKEMLALASKYK